MLDIRELNNKDVAFGAEDNFSSAV
jgi:hypothetical protein